MRSAHPCVVECARRYHPMPARWQSHGMTRRCGYLGIDVGGTKVALRVEGCEDEPYEVRFDWTGQATPEQDIADLTDHIDAVVRQWAAPVSAVGVAMPATLVGGRVTTWPSRPTWNGLDLHGVLGRALPGARIACADDGDVAAYAEADHAGVRDLAYLGVGTGIGGGIVMAGRSVPGFDRGSCEIGHMVVAYGGALCTCGRRGCLQAIASGPATLRRAGEAAGREVTYPELRSAWHSGAPWAVSAVDESCELLAAAAIGVTELVRPSLVVIGGGFADGLPGFTDAVARHCARLARQGHPPAPVRPAALGAYSSLHGAVLLARSVAQMSAASCDTAPALHRDR